MAEKHPTLAQQKQQQQKLQREVEEQKLEELSRQRQQIEQQQQQQQQQQQESKAKKVEMEKCTECKYKTHNPVYMSQHMRIAHPISARNPLRCLLCDFIAVDEKYINAHLHVAHQIKEDKKCPQCSNSFDSQVCYLIVIIIVSPCLYFIFMCRRPWPSTWCTLTTWAWLASTRTVPSGAVWDQALRTTLPAVTLRP